ncbi:MAG: LCP family protein [Candidatus Moraniibacteriota bacterium]
MNHYHRNTDPAAHHPENFSLGKTVLAAPVRPRVSSRRRFLRLTGLVIAVCLLLAGISLVIGTRFTRSLHFENRELSFFQGIRIMGDSLLGTGQTLAGESEGRVNILLLGRAGEKYPGRNLTDTVMLLSLDMKEKRVGLLSLPRDLFAPIPGTGLSTKLNSLYQIGLNEGIGMDVLRGSVAEMTGLPIHYTAMIDFDGFERMIDALGGIRVDVTRDISDSRYPGKNYSYETFELKKGWQKLDGKTALKYARERHDDPEGDFGRTKRQQAIIQAVRERAWSLPTFLNPFTLSSFLESLGDSITTDVPPEAIGRFIGLAQHFDTQNISTVVVDAWKKESLLRVSHIEADGVRAFILVPRSGTWDEIRDVSRHLFDERERERRRTAIEGEAARILILTTPRYRSGAEALAADIRDTFPARSVKLQSDNRLDTREGTAMIQDVSGLRTPYTLDGLIARYGFTPGTLPPGDQTASEDTDLVLLYLRTDTLTLPTLDRTDTSISDLDFQEPLAPQKNPLAH